MNNATLPSGETLALYKSTCYLFRTADETGYGSNKITFSLSAAPEPGTWALMILGFGAAGVAMRRSSKKISVVYA